MSNKNKNIIRLDKNMDKLQEKANEYGKIYEEQQKKRKIANIIWLIETIFMYGSLLFADIYIILQLIK